MGQPRQLHHQEEDQQADDEILPGKGALGVDGDAFELKQEIDEGINADADIRRHEQMVEGGGQKFIEVILLIHEQDLQDQRDRHHMRDEFLRAAVAGVVEPDQPNELDQREDEDRASQSDEVLQAIGHDFATPADARLPRFI